MSRIALIVEVDKEWGIGKNNDLMWHLPADMKFFKETTTGNIIVTGRKNYDSIPERFRPLSNRENAVLTRNASYEAPGAKVFSSLETCLDHYKNEEERTIFVIGGGEIFKETLAMGVVDEMYITYVDGTFDADVFFPVIDESEWESEAILIHEKDEKHAYNFVTKHYLRNCAAVAGEIVKCKEKVFLFSLFLDLSAYRQVQTVRSSRFT